jgi:hypothetical protein
VAQWSDRAGYEGVLIYTDNRSVDPWLAAQMVLQTTSRLTPLVAPQPVCLHLDTATDEQDLMHTAAVLHIARSRSGECA